MIEKEITHENYKEALFVRKQYLHKMKIMRSKSHDMYGMCMNNISISLFDSKRWIADDGVHTLAYGHKDIRRAEAVYKVVQSLNSPFFPPLIGAEPGRAKEESRITCMRMLRTNQSKMIKKY